MKFPNLIVEIQAAFHKTPPGRLGLRRASAMDASMSLDSGDAEQLHQTRGKDLEKDWRQIPPKVLQECAEGLHHLDDAGFKFVLPAVMCWTLQNGTWKELLPEMLFRKLVSDSRAEEKSPSALAKRYQFTPVQIGSIIGWIEAYLVEAEHMATALETNQIQRWKELVA